VLDNETEVVETDDHIGDVPNTSKHEDSDDNVEERQVIELNEFNDMLLLQ
jgi:hypothetical protein